MGWDIDFGRCRAICQKRNVKGHDCCGSLDFSVLGAEIMLLFILIGLMEEVLLRKA